MIHKQILRGAFRVLILLIAAMTIAAGTAWAEMPIFNSISAGGYHTVALANDGTVWAWGNNDYGQLGDGTTSSSTTPVQVSGLSGVIAISAGNSHTVTLLNDGTVWTCGANYYGQLGDGTTSSSTIPVQVSGLSGVIAIAAGGEHTLALLDDGTIRAWGCNGPGELGNGTTVEYSDIPVQVSNLTGVAEIAAGAYHSVARLNDGTVWAWGYNMCGQVGDGTGENNRFTPVQADITGVVAIAAGAFHTMAILNDGTLWAWGSNGVGELGIGYTSNGHVYLPTQVNLTGVVAIDAGVQHSAALLDDGTVWGWGYNGSGQTGDGTTTPSYTPVQAGITGIYEITAVGYHTVALKDDGTIWAWGENNDGQLGDGTTANRNTPTQMVNMIFPSAGSGGNISPSSYVVVTQGSSQTFTITPDACYHVVDVLVDGASVGAVTSYTFNNVTANHTISVMFSNTYTITPSKTGTYGTISPAVPQSVICGSDLTFNISPLSKLLSVFVDGVNQGKLTSYTFSNVTSDHSIVANFK